MKLSRKQVRGLLPGQTLVAECSDISELLSAYVTATSTRRELRLKPAQMPVSCSYKTMTVSVSNRNPDTPAPAPQ